MSEYTLTLLDTTGIQDYIFSSNRLQENIGASELVYRATTLWAFEALKAAGITAHNLDQPESLDWKYNDRSIESDSNLQAEVIQAAGGNTVILFREPEKAREFVRKLTLRLLKEAPGLTVLAQHLDHFNFEQGDLAEARKDIQAQMRQHKQERLVSIPTMGLGVTAMCNSTGLAAVRTPVGKQFIGDDEFSLLVPGQDEQESERNRLISRETAFKLAARDLANARLKHIVGKVAEWYEFPSDIDNLGRISGEESYVAVIHADGNKMGSHVASIVNGAKGNRDYINAMRSFSKNLEVASRAALIEIVEKIVISIKDGLVADKIPLVKDKFHTYIPFRPLVFGGDDVTFLCNGQLGVELATQYLAAFERYTKEQRLDDFYASAGIAIVKMHYPFARAYKLSEELAGSAKSLTREIDCSAIDWHFAQSGLSGSLENIREREYTVEGGKLNVRPLRLRDDQGKPSWAKVESALAEFSGKYWGEKHNKVIGLREALRKDKKGAAAQKYREDFGLNLLPEIAGEEVRKTGWLDGKCYYFDAIELLDHHVSLKNKEAAK
jgi:hypothetical protein